jgi:flagellar hook assembly protein FlgD
MRKKIKPYLMLVAGILAQTCLASDSFGGVIRLSWNRNPELTIQYYAVYKKVSVNAPMTQIAQVAATDTMYLDTDIVLGNTYFYSIQAVNAENRASDFSTEIAVTTTTPDQFNLSQNYPNPFKLQTQFNYYIPERIDVTLTVHDMLGRLVKTLLEQNQNAGRYTLTWDGTDESQNKVVAGMYFMKLRAKNFSQIRKLILER